MRTVRFAAVLALLAVLQASAALGLAQCPGIEDKDGEIKVHLIGAGQCTGSACPSGPDSLVEAITDPLCQLGFLPGECGRCECCRDRSVDLFTGTDVQLVGANPMNFCGIGNRGRPMGEAALCLLRDLAEPARAPSLGGSGIHLKRSANLGIGDVSVEQRIGFVDFNLLERRVRGFHSVSVCAPVLGCVLDQVQPFTATLQQAGGSAACGDYEFRTPSILHVSTEQLEQNVGVELPPIPIYTPIGPFDVKPSFSYELNLEAVTSPWADGNATTQIADTPCFAPHVYDVVDAGGGLLASAIAAPSSDGGWDARLGLGTRDPDPDGTVWAPPAVPFPPRPDFDFSIARSSNEKRPSGRLHTGIDVTYPIGDLAASLAVPPLELEKAEVFVSSALDAAFVSQFALGLEEGKPGFVDIDCKDPPLTRLRMQSAVDVLASIAVKAGVHIDFLLDLGLFERTFSFNPTVDIIDPTVVSSSPVVGPEAEAEMRPGVSDPDSAAFRSFSSFSAGSEDGRAFVDACLTEPPPSPQPEPTPSYQPGDPLDLIRPDEFPCNICLFFPQSITSACLPRQDLVASGAIPADYQCDLAINGMPCTDPNCADTPISPAVSVNVHQVLFPASQASLPTDQRWLCNAFEKFGCFDLCRYDPNAAQPLTIAQSAVTRIGPRCRDGTGGSDPVINGRSCGSDSACDDGNPCTEDHCVFGGEFGVCNITPSDGPCDDGLFCDGADTCALGICGSHAGNPCSASSACCDEQTDSCPAACPQTPCEGDSAGDPCDDHSPCTVDDHCTEGPGGLECRGTAALDCPDTTCVAGVCADVAGAAQCTSVSSGFCPPQCGDGDLDPGEDCDGPSDAACPGQCLPDCSCPPPGRMTGEPCTTPSQCASGFCADGVCCASACDGALQQCNLPDRVGTCTTIEAPAPVLSPAAFVVAFVVLVGLAGLGVRRRSRPHR
jgi:hypothetical protein